jgi:Tol biopolymer transport system component
MQADGRDLMRLSPDGPPSDGLPVWSPDGQRIAFTSTHDENTDIYVMNPDGSQRSRLTNDPAEDRSPAWSPDGQRIAFVSAMDGTGGVFLIDRDGSRRTQLIADPHVMNPAWSPDGQYLAFGSDGRIVTIRLADGHKTTINVLARSLTWSPQ